MGEELRRHTDPVIGKHKLILSCISDRRRQLGNSEFDRSPLRSIFDRIGKQIHENLLQAPPVRNHLLMPHE